ncbi:Uncharacterised protein [Vibrio cholerae]|nr:Uncharacterised protein [Vibrio cholerae]
MIHTFPVVCTNVDNYLYLVRVSSPKLRKLNPKEIFDYEINKNDRCSGWGCCARFVLATRGGPNR